MIKNRGKKQGSFDLCRLRRFAGYSILLIQFILLSACQPAPLEPVLLQFKQSVPISANSPVTLAFETGDSGSLLIQVTGFEVEFESRILDAHGQILNAARLPYIRTGPVYQLLEANQVSGEGEVKVSAIHLTKNAVVSIKVFRLPSGGRVNRLVEQAYRLYSNSVQSTNSEAVDLWRQRVNELHQAADLFRKTGLEEKALWSEYLGAYFTYFPVSEHQSASDLAHAVQVSASDTGLEELELMALQLQGQVMIERGASDAPATAAVKLKKAQQLLRKSAERADQLGMRFEQAWAVNNRGVAYFYQDLLDEALEQYQQVLAIALELQDDYLANLAHGNIAMVNERLGDYQAALGALLAIRQDLEASGPPVERALNLADIGRLYSKLFLFPKAIDALDRALTISRELESKELSGRVGLSLAVAYYDMGQRQRARDMLMSAIDDMEEVHFGRGLRDAYRLLADMHRFRGAHDQAGIYREQQRQYLSSDREQAEYLFSQGLDALAVDNLVLASELFARSLAGANDLENESLQVRALLQYCALDAALAAEEEVCDPERMENRLKAWLTGAAPRFAFDARLSWARFLESRGVVAKALVVLEELVEEIRLYRSSLPGVLGAWYWESRERVFTTYMDLILRRAHSQQQMEDALVILDTLRNLENARQLSDSATGDRLREIRALLARMSRARDNGTREELSRAIDQELLALGAGAEYRPVHDRHLSARLRSLPPDSAFLTYHFSGTDGWAWIATWQGVRLVRLGDAQSIRELLSKVRESVRVVGNSDLEQQLDELGALMIRSLGVSLPANIFLGSTGALAGFPFGAIRHEGNYLAQDHVVINVLSLAGLDNIADLKWRPDQWDSIFLAGAPKGIGLAGLEGAASEIEDIARLFRLHEVHTFAGDNLQRTSFLGPVFDEAHLVHIASHGSINFDYPELSRLVLSGGLGNDVASYLTPVDIRQSHIRAGLVVLNACETTGMNTFSFDSNLGFVSEFLQAGADAVVATLWPVPDRYTRDFMLDFYSTALNGVTIPEVLTLTKRRYMNTAQPEGGLGWATYQIYVN